MTRRSRIASIRFVMAAGPLVWVAAAHGQQQLQSSVISCGGGTAESARFTLRGTIGEPAVGILGSPRFSIRGGAESVGPQATTCPADFDQSGILSVQDLFEFLVAYFVPQPRADFNNSGTVTVQDIFDFLVAYFAGCP